MRGEINFCDIFIWDRKHIFCKQYKNSSRKTKKNSNVLTISFLGRHILKIYHNIPIAYFKRVWSERLFVFIQKIRTVALRLLSPTGGGVFD